MRPNDRPRQSERVVWRAGDEGVVLLDPEDGQYFALDETGGRVWLLCDGSRSASDIAAVLEQEYDVTAEEARSDVLELLKELADERLVSVA